MNNNNNYINYNDIITKITMNNNNNDNNYINYNDIVKNNNE